jgi:hypothetical protein
MLLPQLKIFDDDERDGSYKDLRVHIYSGLYMSQEHFARDLNANVIWENIFKPTIWNNSLHESNNDNKISEFSHNNNSNS